MEEKEKIHFYLEGFNFIKNEAIKYFASKEHFVPEHLSFVLDSFVMACTLGFNNKLPEHLKIDNKTAENLIYFSNMDSLEEIHINREWYNGNKFIKNELILNSIPIFYQDIKVLGDNRKFFEEAISSMLEMFISELVEYKKALKEYSDGIGRGPNGWYCHTALFVHPFYIINFNHYDLIKNLKDDTELWSKLRHFDYIKMISTLSKNYNEYMLTGNTLRNYINK